jgi:hypothetical protein
MKPRENPLGKTPPFAQFPVHWLPIIIQANAFRAVPLLVALTYQMKLGHTLRVPITERTWKLAGCSHHSRAQRRAMLVALNRIPSIVRLEYRNRTGSKYAASTGVRFKCAPLEAQDAS